MTLFFCGDIMPGGVLPFQNDFITAELLGFMRSFDYRIGTLESAIGTNLPFDPVKMNGRQNIIYARDEDFRHLQLGPFLTGRIYEIPGCNELVGSLDIFIKNIETFVIMLILPSVLIRNTPFGVSVAFKVLKSLLLSLLTDMEEELNHQITIII